jgi:hypothetical protein
MPDLLSREFWQGGGVFSSKPSTAHHTLAKSAGTRLLLPVKESKTI